jgi:hypothetical protein
MEVKLKVKHAFVTREDGSDAVSLTFDGPHRFMARAILPAGSGHEFAKSLGLSKVQTVECRSGPKSNG